MPRIILSRLELVQKFFLSITIAFARHSSIGSDLLNPRESEAAERKRKEAARRLAEHLAADLETSKHEVTRNAINDEGEAILERLRMLRDQKDD